jgi:hypothetical protein
MYFIVYFHVFITSLLKNHFSHHHLSLGPPDPNHQNLEIHPNLLANLTEWCLLHSALFVKI